MTKSDGTTMSLSNTQGKKVLIVNIATSSEYRYQIQQLQQLQQLHQQNLVVLAFPSNSFGNEAHSNSEIAQLVTDSFQVTYPVSQIANVRGSNVHPVYGWLSDSSANGVRSINVTKDYQKILLNEQGKIVGIFNSMVSPLDNKIQNAITSN